jgi:hypothetical protein
MGSLKPVTTFRIPSGRKTCLTLKQKLRQRLGIRPEFKITNSPITPQTIPPKILMSWRLSGLRLSLVFLQKKLELLLLLNLPQVPGQQYGQTC